MNSTKQTKGRQLVSMLKRRGMTTMEMLMTGISVSPWKRVVEGLRPGEHLVKTKNKRGLVVYRVLTATRWTA